MTTIIGRNDSMVKIRGYTVYLSAIEETFRKHCDAADAAVLAENEDEVNKRLVAYVVRGPRAAWKVDGKSGTSRDLRAQLERHLPLYMVPSHFMELETLPINQQTGKLERKALPALRERRPAVKQRTPLSKHATAAERRRVLRELWSEALDVNTESLEDDWNFFDLGGHSLTGLGLTLGIEQQFGIELRGTEIYEYPTISELGAYLEKRGPNMESGISLAEDSILDPEIAPGGAPRITRISEASSVLVTGTTGFLGAFLLDELVRAAGQDTRFYCLVRDRDSGQGESTNRVLDTLRFYGLASHSAGERIVPVAGDLTQPRMGLDNDYYRRLAKEIGLIFHCAASVNYAYPYSAAKPHTVERDIGGAQVRLHRCNQADSAHFIQRHLPGRRRLPLLGKQRHRRLCRQDGGGLQSGQMGCGAACLVGCFSRTAGMRFPPGQHWSPQWYRYGQPE